jgi:predicted  nucleic acid-binding Zn-ribbon protein
MATEQRIAAEQRQQMIAEAAYLRAEGRGFTDGDPFLDWLDAEREIDALLNVPKAENWVKQLESQLSTGRDRLATMRQGIASKGKAARAELKKDLEKLDEKLDSFETKLRELRARGAKVTHRARQQAEKAWDEISELTHRLGGSNK